MTSMNPETPESLHRSELMSLACSKTLDPHTDYPGMSRGIDAKSIQNDVPMALRWSALLLAIEAIESYASGWFQAAILCAGAAIERALKESYISANGKLPQGHWTLGALLDTKKIDWTGTEVTAMLLTKVASILSPRNSRAHALLEMAQPELALLGGDYGRVQVSENYGLLEPYRRDAKAVMEVLFVTLDALYGK